MIAAIGSYGRNVRREFGQSHDSFRLVGEDNIRRYLPVRELRVRIHPDDTAFDLLARVCAAKAAGCRITVSAPEGFNSPALETLEEWTEHWAGNIEFVEETNEVLAQWICDGQTGRIRYAAPDRAPEIVLAAAHEAGLYIARSPVLAHGRIELLWYVREQSISHDYHRYGNLGPRAEEERAEVP